MNLAQLKKHLASLKAKGKEIVEAADAAGGEFTAEQDAEFTALEAQIAETESKIKAAEVLDQRRRSVDALPAGQQAASPAGHNTVHDSDPALTAGFRDIGEFAVAVHGAVGVARTGGVVDERLGALAGAHQGGGGNGEGYMLPPQFRDEVWELMAGFDEFGPLIDEEPTGAREVKLGADETTPWGTAGIRAYWRKEGAQMTPSQLSDEGRNVPLHELYCLATASEELLEDAARLQNRLTKKAAMAIAWKKNLAIVEGNGVGQPMGWMSSGAKLTIGKESGQSAETINATNVLKMASRLQTVPGDKPFWLVNQDCLPQLATMTIGDKPIWIPPNGLVDAPGGFLLGKPVRWSEFSQTVGTEGDIQLISPKGYYGVRRAAGVQAASSIHLYFDYAVQAFRWMFRYGGQPHLSAPVSPAKGSSTRSHFVTLATRA
jgi:HK97 family phage major capsid protein